MQSLLLVLYIEQCIKVSTWLYHHHWRYFYRLFLKMFLISFTRLYSLSDVADIVTEEFLVPLFYERSSFALVCNLVRSLNMFLLTDIFELFQHANLIEKLPPTYSIDKGIQIIWWAVILFSLFDRERLDSAFWYFWLLLLSSWHTLRR